MSKYRILEKIGVYKTHYIVQEKFLWWWKAVEGGDICISTGAQETMELSLIHI